MLLSAKDSDPHRRVVRRTLGEIAAELGNHKEALQELSAYRRMTGDLKLDDVIADAYRSLGRPEKALEFLADLGPADVPPPVYARVLIARARAQADLGRGAQAIALLTRGFRDARGDQRAAIGAAIKELQERA